MNTVAIVGVGLIGGSFGLALRRAGFRGRIIGVSRPDALAKAQEVGAIDSGAPLEEAASEADLIYLAQPISRILQTIPRVVSVARREALITDAGSTKAAIVETAKGSQSQFLGGHPLAGKETRGVESASADLFDGRIYVLTPLRDSELESPAAQAFTSWLANIGAVTIVMNPKDHDRTLAYTSHLPQLASTALAALLNRTGERVSEVFGPALVDSTRLALSPYEIWKDILDTNQNEVERVLDEYISILRNIQESLRNSSLDDYFSDGAEFASKVRRR